MANNSVLPSNDTIRDIDRGTAKTQVMLLDIGGTASESILSPTNPLNIVLDNTGQGGLKSLDDNATVAQGADAPQFNTIVGDPNGDFAGINLLEQLIDDGSGLSMRVRLVNPQLTDINGNAIPSDAPKPITLTGGIGYVFIIDTQGYQSISFTTATGVTATITNSNDGVTYSNLLGSNIATGAMLNTLAATTAYIFPCPCRYIKVALTAAGSITAYLRQTKWDTYIGNPTLAQNISQWGGTAVVTGGVAGSVGLGGQAATGALPGAQNPVFIAGIDNSTVVGTGAANNQVRPIKTDTTGRIQTVPAADTQGVIRPNPLLPTSYMNQASVNVQETSQFEGQNFTELLAQILLELKILNQQLFAMPSMLNSGTNAASDEPATFRADPTVFN